MRIHSVVFKVTALLLLATMLVGCGGDSGGGPPSSDAKLERLSLGAGFLSAPFDPDRFTYTAEVDPRNESLRVVAVGRDDGVRIEINENPAASGEASNRVALEQGAMTAITVQTTSEDGENSQTYTVEVSRPYALDADPGLRKATLRWDDVGASSYNLYYSTEPGCDTANYSTCPGGAMLSSVTPPHTVENLSNGQNYWFQVEAVDIDAPYNEAGIRPDVLVPNGQVEAIERDADGRAYIGGEFHQVGFPAGGGVLVDRLTDAHGAFPLVDGHVHAAVGDGVGGVYIGGRFREVGGESRRNLAHIRADGSLGEWNPEANRIVSSLAIQDDTIYAGGWFSEINGTPRDAIAAIGSDGSLKEWRPYLGVGNYNTTVTALAASGDTVYAGVSILNDLGGGNYKLSVIDSNGNVSNEIPLADGGVSAFSVSDDVVYMGGDFKKVNGKDRDHLAAIRVDGGLTSWSPSADAWVSSLAVTDDIVYIGGGLLR